MLDAFAIQVAWLARREGLMLESQSFRDAAGRIISLVGNADPATVIDERSRVTIADLSLLLNALQTFTLPADVLELSLDMTGRRSSLLALFPERRHHA
jgi:hypothetical protein